MTTRAATHPLASPSHAASCAHPKAEQPLKQVFKEFNHLGHCGLGFIKGLGHNTWALLSWYNPRLAIIKLELSTNIMRSHD
jgi:hypothetical protein